MNQNYGLLTMGGGIESYDKGFVIIGNNGLYKYGLILKTNINGYELWRKFIGNGVNYNVPENLEQTLDKGYIISGSTTKYDTEDAFILKLDPCFEKEWCKVLYTSNYYNDYARRVKPLPDGGYLLLTAYYEGLEQGKRIHLHKFDQQGNIIWQNSYMESDTLLFGEEGFDLTIVNNNEYLITGYCYYPDPGESGGWRRPLLIKVDSSGNAFWETIWGANDYFYGRPWNNSIVNNSGNIYNVGYRVAENAQLPVLFKTNHTGQEVFYVDLVDSCYIGDAAAPTWMEDSLIYTQIGWQNWDESWYWGFYQLDTTGNILNHKDVINPLVAIVSSVRTFDNKYLSVGIRNNEELNRWEIYAYKLNSDLEYDTLYNTPFVYDSLCPYEIPSDTTDLDCDILVLIDDQFVPLEQVQIKIYPNPATDKIIVSYPDITRSRQRDIMIFNAIGAMVNQIRLARGDEQTEINVSSFPPGVYFVAILESGTRITGGKFIVVKP